MSEHFMSGSIVRILHLVFRSIVIVYLISGNVHGAYNIHSTAKRLSRTVPGFSMSPQLYIAPLDSQRGVRLHYFEDNQVRYNYVLPWICRVDGYPGSAESRDVYPLSLPIAIYGKDGGGTPMYVGLSYSFMVNYGRSVEYIGERIDDVEFQILVYRKSDFENGSSGVEPIDRYLLPKISSLSGQDNVEFFNGGAQLRNLDAYGLETRLRYFKIDNTDGVPLYPWDVFPLISHNATSPEYYFVLECRTHGSGGLDADWTALYAFDFTERKSGDAVAIDRPNFNGEPIPPRYQGRSIDELKSVRPVISIRQMPTDPLDCLEINTSPELRRSADLDRLVSNLNNDPIKLAEYVFNRVNLVDVVNFNPVGPLSETSLNWGGVKRNAQAVFLEGEGSPIEQCALLVYLLRQAGVPAAYVFPDSGGVKILDDTAVQLLQMQIKEAQDLNGSAVVTRLVTANYPWVMAYVSGSWVHLFPWMKDIEIIEGEFPYHFFPKKYATAYDWLYAYITGASGIYGQMHRSATPGDVFVDYIDRILRTSGTGKSREDVGIKIRYRQRNFSSWNDFPMPFSFEGDAQYFQKLSEINSIFDTASFSIGGYETPKLRICDLHNRQLTLRTVEGGENENALVLSLGKASAGGEGVGDFSSAEIQERQEIVIPVSNQLPYDAMFISVSLRSNRFLPEAFFENRNLEVPPIKGWGGLMYEVRSSTDLSYLQGQLAVLYLCLGRVNERMIDFHVSQYNKFIKESSGPNPPPVLPEVYEGYPLFIMALNWIKADQEFVDVNQELHKVKVFSAPSFCMAMLDFKRGQDNLILEGTERVYPGFNISGLYSPRIFNGSMRPDVEKSFPKATIDFNMFRSVNASALEHEIINRFFQQKDSISSVRLLQIASDRVATGGDPMVQINSVNYDAESDKLYGGVPLKDIDPLFWPVIPGGLWSQADLLSAWVTPGNITTDSEAYSGMGALIFSVNGYVSAPIAFNRNGGHGEPIGWPFSEANFPYTSLSNNGDNFYFKIDGVYVKVDAISRAKQGEFIDHVSGGQADIPPVDWSYLQRVAGKYNYILTGNEATDKAALLEFVRANGSVSPLTGVVNFKNLISDPVDVVTGEFYLDTVDLSLPGPMPLNLRRNYRSQNLGDSEFGRGWAMTYAPSLTVSPDESRIYAGEMDGSVVVYAKQEDGQGNTWWQPLAEDNPTLNNARARGIGTSNRFLNLIERFEDEEENVSYVLIAGDGSTRLFEHQTFEYGGLIVSHPFLKEWTDAVGNKLKFEYGSNDEGSDYGKVCKIVASNGNFLGFYYDSIGHITEAYTGDGRWVSYQYDQYGDLRKVLLPDGGEHRYDYLHEEYSFNGGDVAYSTHLLNRETKPEGRVLENVYDSERRVVQQRARVGENEDFVVNATLVYHHVSSAEEPKEGYTEVSDAYNRMTLYEYSDGLIFRVTDPLENSEEFEYYEVDDVSPGAYPRSLKSYLSKSGLLRECEYDEYGNLVRDTIAGDLKGDGTLSSAETIRLFNDNQLLESVIDPSGILTEYLYGDTSSPFLLTEIRSSIGGTVVGKVEREYHSVANGAIYGAGLLFREKRAGGTVDEAIVEWSHSEKGFVTGETRYSGSSDPNLVRGLEHNLRGELVKETDARLRSTKFAFDNMGREIWSERRDESGALLSWGAKYYNRNGELVWIDGPRYNPEDYTWLTYNASGRLREKVQWMSQADTKGTGVKEGGYSTSVYRYDAFGNLIQSWDTFGNLTSMEYDAIGQLLVRNFHVGEGAESDILASEQFKYEPGGQVAEYKSPLNGVTKNFYTSTGKLARRENPDGSILEWRYRTDGRVDREIGPNGSYWIYTYSDGLREMEKEFFSAAHVSLGRETFQYDRRGNLISHTDLENNIFTTEFDDLDRPKVVTGPAPGASDAAKVQRFFYDNCGDLIRVENNLDESTVKTYDALHRLIREDRLDASQTLVQRVTSRYSADHHSVITEIGSGSDLLVSTEYSDLSGLPLLRKAADGTFQIWQYDAAGNLLKHIDELRRSTSYAYDPLNRLARQTLKDGAVVTFDYDAGGNLTRRAMPGGLEWLATYDSASRLTGEALSDGSTSSREIDYTYHSSGANRGLLASETRSDGVVTAYNYDDFRRIQSSVSSGTAAYQTLNRAFQYDRLGHLVRATQEYANNTVSPSSEVLRTVDAYGRITSEKVLLGGNVHSSFVQHWNAEGRRTLLATGPEITPQGTGAGTEQHRSHRADGLLAGLSVNGQSYQFGYGTNGLLVSRTNPWRTETIATRDQKGRIGSSQETHMGTEQA